jgi:hypothetical protein
VPGLVVGKGWTLPEAEEADDAGDLANLIRVTINGCSGFSVGDSRLETAASRGRRSCSWPLSVAAR